MKNNILSLFTLLFFSSHHLTSANYVLGSLDLDPLTFNKTLSAFYFTIVKFDNGYPNGVKHQVWSQLARELGEVKEVSVGEVRIKDYGDTRNKELADRFGVTKDMYPVIVLFTRQQVKKGEKAPTFKETRFAGEMTMDAIKSFVKRETGGIYLNLPGCLRKYDDLAETFVTHVERRETTLAWTEKEVREETEEVDRVKGEKYVRVMRSVVVEGGGVEAIGKEEERLVELGQQQGVSLEERAEIQKTLNVMKAFKKKEENA